MSDVEDFTDTEQKVVLYFAIAIGSLLILITVCVFCGVCIESIRDEASDQTRPRSSRGDIEMNLEPPIRISEDATNSVKEPPPTYQAVVGIN